MVEGGVMRGARTRWREGLGEEGRDTEEGGVMRDKVKGGAR